MSRYFSEMKRNIEKKFLELRAKREIVIGNFRNKVKEAKIEKIRNNILNK